jgi:hypothetical protein
MPDVKSVEPSAISSDSSSTGDRCDGEQVNNDWATVELLIRVSLGTVQPAPLLPESCEMATGDAPSIH